jgi:hypothetical protein
MATLLPLLYPIIYPAITFYTIKYTLEYTSGMVINTVISKAKSGMWYIVSYPFVSNEIISKEPLVPESRWTM